MDPMPSHTSSSVTGADTNTGPRQHSGRLQAQIEHVTRLAETRDHENLKIALESRSDRLTQVIEAALLLLYKNPDTRKQSMECLINNATNWFFNQFSATQFLTTRWEYLPLDVISITLFALDIALDTRPVLERALAVAVTAACGLYYPSAPLSIGPPSVPSRPMLYTRDQSLKHRSL
ncbi:hypothetical protein BCR44DRAFT_79828 [Catenaria anguillulae PL171]|uniref:Uncharacterized protein n=1 Tax=Catenaria anguillulae PL171 TaxID=765915 RepID=A0A1Y2HS97_9FUNG|nr:hypothetical protein BCR44DRAFT_79828 [Catenaria anguillulae PL171]